MSCGKCAKRGGLCAMSFGLAVGIVSFFAAFIWSLFLMRHGLPADMVGHMEVPTLTGSFVHALWYLLKGFLFGFFVALVYDLITCCCKCKRCWGKSEDGKCGCGNASCACSTERK